ncbi:MAG: hypothetical protein KF867_06705 [Cryobacterium sp.]|nr:hypothetical protein [Cryobacterium sp.]
MNSVTSNDDSRLVNKHPWQLVALAIVVFVESALCALASAWLVFELFTQKPASLAGAIFILVLALLAAGWLLFVGLSALKTKPWTRGAILTWQVLQLAVAVGSFQGLFARDDVGWVLLVPVVLAILLLFSKPVLDATKRA